MFEIKSHSFEINVKLTVLSFVSYKGMTLMTVIINLNSKHIQTIFSFIYFYSNKALDQKNIFK